MVYGHLDDPHHAELVRGKSYLQLRPGARPRSIAARRACWQADACAAGMAVSRSQAAHVALQLSLRSPRRRETPDPGRGRLR